MMDFSLFIKKKLVSSIKNDSVRLALLVCVVVFSSGVSFASLYCKDIGLVKKSERSNDARMFSNSTGELIGGMERVEISAKISLKDAKVIYDILDSRVPSRRSLGSNEHRANILYWHRKDAAGDTKRLIPQKVLEKIVRYTDEAHAYVRSQFPSKNMVLVVADVMSGVPVAKPHTHPANTVTIAKALLGKSSEFVHKKDQAYAETLSKEESLVFTDQKHGSPLGLEKRVVMVLFWVPKENLEQAGYDYNQLIWTDRKRPDFF